MKIYRILDNCEDFELRRFLKIENIFIENNSENYDRRNYNSKSITVDIYHNNTAAVGKKYCT